MGELLAERNGNEINIESYEVKPRLVTKTIKGSSFKWIFRGYEGWSDGKCCQDFYQHLFLKTFWIYQTKDSCIKETKISDEAQEKFNVEEGNVEDLGFVVRKSLSQTLDSGGSNTTQRLQKPAGRFTGLRSFVKGRRWRNFVYWWKVCCSDSYFIGHRLQ